MQPPPASQSGKTHPTLTLAAIALACVLLSLGEPSGYPVVLVLFQVFGPRSCTSSLQ